MRYEYRDEWYRGVEGTGSCRGSAEKNRAKKRTRTSAGVVRVLASLVLCVAASYAGAAVTGTGLSSDDIPMGEAARPSEDASFVMSWSWDTAVGETEEADAAGAGDADDADDAHAERIKELADAYIAEKSGKTGE